MYANRSLRVTFVEFQTTGPTAKLDGKSANRAAASNRGPSKRAFKKCGAESRRGCFIPLAARSLGLISSKPGDSSEGSGRPKKEAQPYHESVAEGTLYS
jgi:hypothetical protein